LNIQDLEQAGTLNVLPEKGSAVIGYFVERGDVLGAFYMAIVEQSGGTQYRLRWSDNSTEIFRSIEGKTSRYQYFHLLGYISMGDYRKHYSARFSFIEDLPPIYSDPSRRIIASHQDQTKKIRKIKKQYYTEKLDIPDDISDGRPIVFLFVRCLDEPMIIERAFSRMFDGIVYADIDDNLERTDNEDDYLYIPRQHLLSVGNEPNQG
jgi:hypothetical protein